MSGQRAPDAGRESGSSKSIHRHSVSAVRFSMPGALERCRRSCLIFHIMPAYPLHLRHDNAIVCRNASCQMGFVPVWRQKCCSTHRFFLMVTCQGCYFVLVRRAIGKDRRTVRHALPRFVPLQNQVQPGRDVGTTLTNQVDRVQGTIALLINWYAGCKARSSVDLTTSCRLDCGRHF